MNAPHALQTEVLTALAQRRTLVNAELRLFLWLMATQSRNRRYYIRDFEVALELARPTVQKALTRLCEQGMIVTSAAPRQQGRDFRPVLNPALWLPEHRQQQELSA